MDSQLNIGFNRENKKRQMILRIVLACIIFIVSLRYILFVYQPTILDDEFSYIGIAKYLVGKDWTGVMSFTRYYSYGYSLWLVPFVYFIDDTVILYRMIVGINGFFLIGGYLFLEQSLTYLFRNRIASGSLKKEWVIFVSFIVTMIPCNMNYASVALSECLLYFLFQVILFECINVTKRKCKIYHFVILGVLSMYIYTVHQRMLCVVLAVCILIAYQLVKYRDEPFRWLYFGTLFIGYCIHRNVKSTIRTELWRNGIKSDVNDIGGVWGNIQGTLSGIDSIISFLVGILGKITYLSASTFLIELIAIFVLTRKLINKKKSFLNVQIEMFIMLSFVFSLVLSGIYMHTNDTVFRLFYGRYMETFMPLLFGYGILWLLSDDRSMMKRIIFFGEILLLFFFVETPVYIYMKVNDIKKGNYISCGQIYRFMGGEYLHMFKMTAVVVAGFVAVIIVMAFIKNRDIALYGTGVCMFVYFLSTASIPFKDINLQLQEERYSSSMIVDKIESMLDKDGKIYYYYDSEEDSSTAQYVEYLQYWMDERPISMLTDSTVENTKIHSNDFVIFSCDDETRQEVLTKMSGEKGHYEIVMKNENCKVARYKNDENASKNKTKKTKNTKKTK